MSTITSSANDVVRRGLLKISDATVLATVDSLNLKGTRLQAIVGIPLRTLRQRRDVATFATTAPIAAVMGLLELLALAPLERVVEALGDHADAPSYEQLSGALDGLILNGATTDDVVALLTFAIGEAFPAAPHCRRFLEEREELQLPELPELASPTSLLAPKEVDTEVREQRRLRREQEKSKKKKATAARLAKPVKAKCTQKDRRRLRRPSRPLTPLLGWSSAAVCCSLLENSRISVPTILWLVRSCSSTFHTALSIRKRPSRDPSSDPRSWWRPRPKVSWCRASTRIRVRRGSCFSPGDDWDSITCVT